jgi:hypothetical protein
MTIPTRDLLDETTPTMASAKVAMLTAKRMREHSTLFASLLGVVAILCGLGVGLTAYLSTAATDGVRAEVASRHGAAVGLQISMVRAPDADGQDSDVREAIAASFVTDGRPVPFQIDRTVSALSSPVPFVRLDSNGAISDLRPDEDPAEPDADGRSVMLSIPDLTQQADLVEGRWPSDASGVSVQADAAALLDLAPGDRIRLGTADVVVTGTWRVQDPLDPRWLGDEIVTSGSDADGVGPIVVDESVWELIDVRPWGRWTLIPIADQLEVGDLATITRVWDDLSTVFKRVSNLDISTLNRDGRLARTAIEIESRVHALEAVQPVALLIIGSIAVIALLELARLLAAVRSTESELLWSRGASAGALMRSTALEAGMTALLGAALGTAAATGVVGVASGRGDALLSTGSALWMVPAATILGTIGIFALVTFRAARRSLGRDTATVSGRSRTIAGTGGVALLVVAAAVSTWQLLLYGSPLTPTANGGREVDPIAVLSPALAMVAVVLVGLIAFPKVAPLVERLARNGTGAPGILAARNVARSLQFAATPIVLVALACGQLVVAASYASTWSTAYDQTEQLRSGSALRLITGLAGLTERQMAAVLSTDGVEGVAAVQLTTVAVADDYVSLVAATPLAIQQLANTANGALDPAALAEQVAAKPYQPVLPDQASGVRFVIGTQGFDTAPAVIARLGDPFGNMVAVALSATEQEAALPADDPVGPPIRTWDYDGQLPHRTAEGGWRVLALDVLADPAELDRSILIESLSAVGGDSSGQVPTGAHWTGRMFDRGVPSIVEALTGGLGFPVVAGADLVRLLPTFDGAAEDDVLAPVVVSAALARQYGLEVGDSLPVGVIDNEQRHTAAIMGIVPAIPGASYENAMLMDSTIVDGLQLRADPDPVVARQFWLAADDPAAVATALRTELPAQVRIEALAIDPSRTMLASAVVALWIGAIGSALLAIVAVSTVAGAQLRSRRAEVVILRAVGLSSGSLASIRRRELFIVLGYGALVGLLSGTLVTTLVLSSLARAAVPGPFASLPTTVQVDVPLLALALAALAGLIAAVVALYGNQVATQARTLSAREEVR